jgi:hypothetical protein
MLLQAGLIRQGFYVTEDTLEWFLSQVFILDGNVSKFH